MAVMKKFFVQLFDFFSSIKLAIPLILILAVILGTGTFYEAAYGTEAAQRVIYHSWYMKLEMFLLILSLTCATIDRIPWKKHHIGFVVTHAGIIILILGSFITQERGIDGNLVLGINDAADSFIVNDKELHVYQSFDGKPFALLFQKPVNFDNDPPGKHRYQYRLVDSDVLKVVDYYPRSIRKLEVSETQDKKGKPAFHFTLANAMVNVNEWLGLDGQIPPFYDLGPATVTFIAGPLPKPPEPRNQIVVYQENPKAPVLKYAVFSMRQMKPTSQGILKLGQPVDTGWMGLKFNVDKFFLHSQPQVTYQRGEFSPETDNLPPAVEVEVNGNRSWFELDNPHEIKGKTSSYFVNFTRKRYELGFQIALKKFKMGLYGGSNLPKTYASTVLVNNKKETVISMNEPLTFHNYTLYQSSYETNERGEPVISVFSVNFDPGRKMKYFGAICICSGIAIMFYFKPRWTRKKRIVNA